MIFILPTTLTKGTRFHSIDEKSIESRLHDISRFM